LPSKEDRGTATGDMYRKFDEIWTVVSEIGKQTDKQTDEHTERLNTISTPGAKY